MSQYASSITGNVLLNIRGIDKYLYNIGGNHVIPGKNSLAILDDTITKYSDYSLKTLQNKTIWFRFKDIDTPSNVKKWTLAFWYYTKNSLFSRSEWMYSGLSANSSVYTNEPAYFFLPNMSRSIGLYIQLTEHRNSTNDTNIMDGGTYRLMQEQSINTWNYYAVTRNDNYFYIFRNGTLLTSKAVVNEPWYSINSISTSNMGSEDYFDDIFYMEDQCLWTSSFTVPDNYLLGDSSTLIKTKMWPYDHYDDKIYLY